MRMAAPKKTLASDLEACLKRRYDNEVPQANMLAWLDGKAEPTALELKVLQAWLDL